MKLDLRENIAGFPPLTIRDLLKKNNSINYEIAAKFLGLSENKAKKVLQELMKLGFIESIETDSFMTHTNTIKGNSLALSKAIPPISKTKAEQLFSEFISRVKSVNENPDYLYKVTKVILFGSFITDSPTVNDIDIAIEYIQKETGEEFMNAHSQKIENARKKGKRFYSFVDQMLYSYREVELYIKSRSRYLSLHKMDDDILNQTKTLEIPLD